MPNTKRDYICDIISQSTVAKTDIRKLVHKTFYTNKKENYGIICLHGNTASLENVGVGDAEHIPSSKTRFSGCSGRAEKLAEIHTHPGRSLLMSEGDILDSFRRKIDTTCIAVETESKENRVRCHTLKNEYKNKSIHTNNLKREIEQIVKQVREADDRAFKATFSMDEKLRSEAYSAEKEIKEKYWKRARELHNLMDDSLNWFDYCDLRI